jgi:hypothetical protein
VRDLLHHPRAGPATLCTATPVWLLFPAPLAAAREQTASCLTRTPFPPPPMRSRIAKHQSRTRHSSPLPCRSHTRLIGRRCSADRLRPGGPEVDFVSGPRPAFDGRRVRRASYGDFFKWVRAHPAPPSPTPPSAPLPRAPAPRAPDVPPAGSNRSGAPPVHDLTPRCWSELLRIVPDGSPPEPAVRSSAEAIARDRSLECCQRASRERGFRPRSPDCIIVSPRLSTVLATIPSVVVVVVLLGS